MLSSLMFFLTNIYCLGTYFKERKIKYYIILWFIFRLSWIVMDSSESWLISHVFLKINTILIYIFGCDKGLGSFLLVFILKQHLPYLNKPINAS